MQLENAKNESDFIEAVRGVYRAYVPESDAWAKPNFFDINSTVIGGALWSVINEARNGIDMRLNPQTARGEWLDKLVSNPPLNLTRKSATTAEGAIKVILEDITTVAVGYEFIKADGTAYRATEEVALVNGKGIVQVESLESGTKANSADNQKLTSNNGIAYSIGIYGGYDAECDEQLRRRLFSIQSENHYFGSQCNLQDTLSAMRGVSRSWVVQDGLVVNMLFLMEGKYPCGIPRAEDYQAAKDYMNDDCRSSMFFCPVFDAPKSVTIAPEIAWGNGQPSICDVTENMTAWLRENHDLGDGLRSSDIQRFLDDNYGYYDPKIIGCCEYEAKCDTIYNCVELLSC